MAESFFATLECELLDQYTFRTQAEARLAIFEFIEGRYNLHRRHASLGYLSPQAYEQELHNPAITYSAESRPSTDFSHGLTSQGTTNENRLQLN